MCAYEGARVEEARFKATLPCILSAVKVSGDGGTRIQLDIPETDEPEALRLLLWRGRVLDVIVRPCADDGRIDTDKRRELHI